MDGEVVPLGREELPGKERALAEEVMDLDESRIAGEEGFQTLEVERGRHGRLKGRQG